MSKSAFDKAKTLYFLYFLVIHVVKAHRHVRARGLVSTGKEFYTWLAQVRRIECTVDAR